MYAQDFNFLLFIYFFFFFLQNCANVILQVQTCSESYHGCFFLS